VREGVHSGSLWAVASTPLFCSHFHKVWCGVWRSYIGVADRAGGGLSEYFPYRGKRAVEVRFHRLTVVVAVAPFIYHRVAKQNVTGQRTRHLVAGTLDPIVHLLDYSFVEYTLRTPDKPQVCNPLACCLATLLLFRL